MMHRLSPVRTWSALAGGLIALLAVGGASGAASIHACLKAKGGVRIVPAGTPCKSAETPLEWAVEGPPGPPGPGRGGALVGGGTGTTAPSTPFPVFVPLFDSRAETDFFDRVAQRVPVAGTFSHLTVTMDVSSSGGVSRTFMLIKNPTQNFALPNPNGIVTPLACTIGSDARDCTNDANTATVAPGEFVALRITTILGLDYQATPIRWTAVFTPD